MQKLFTWLAGSAAAVAFVFAGASCSRSEGRGAQAPSAQQYPGAAGATNAGTGYPSGVTMPQGTGGGPSATEDLGGDRGTGSTSPEGYDGFGTGTGSGLGEPGSGTAPADMGGSELDDRDIDRDLPRGGGPQDDKVRGGGDAGKPHGRDHGDRRDRGDGMSGGGMSGGGDAGVMPMIPERGQYDGGF
jgi:hypothetical protein